MKPPRAKSKVIALVLLAGVLPFLASLAAHLIIGDAKHVQEPLHEGFELAGCCIALGVAMILLLRLQHENASSHLFWVVAALVAMGIVDGMHSFLPTGVAFSWTRHGATLVGGAFFALVWLPLPVVVVRRKVHFILLVAVLAIAGSLAILWWPERLPAPWVAGVYSRSVIATNVLGGLGFLAAAVFFIRRYLREPQGENLVFASHTLLFGTASLFFGFSHVWGADWWVWHGARLLAYAIVLAAAQKTSVAPYQHLARHTQELLKANEDLRTEVVERQRVEVEVTRQSEEQTRLNAALTRSNRATLNLMQDAVQAKDRLEKVNQELQLEIAERQRAEDKLKETLLDLERSNKELEQFAYVASHDLQEPLRMVASYTQLLEKRYGDKLDSDAREFIQFAVDGAIRMQRLINDLLVYSRLGTRGKTFEPTDSHEVLGQAIANLSALIEENQALVTNDDLPTIMADESQMVQLFQNLIGNAIKFRTHESPRIHVSAEQKGGEWLFTVRDNGIGIDPQHKDRIFVIFQRLHSKEEYPGTGVMSR